MTGLLTVPRPLTRKPSAALLHMHMHVRRFRVRYGLGQLGC